ncbi:monocarboxylate transporter 9-like isoform X2 [Penaeus japonicus]|uniref:monocarboxylate transporter 9-like isoform X2 n=1 Tax=Penaeus japonicus TaxID=27405 RepID=UPI001C717552|nr:monocarboxylate transporter 9-like isoform X2 [Penaeus japonicus]
MVRVAWHYYMHDDSFYTRSLLWHPVRTKTTRTECASVLSFLALQLPVHGVESCRKVAVTAALMSASSLFLSSLVNSPYLLLLTFSLIHGIGGGINITCCFYITAKYFKKRLGIANSIMMTGGSVGIILLPQLASRLQENYPFTWATLITGAVTLHAAVGSLLFHPVEWHMKEKEMNSEEKADTEKLLLELGTNSRKSAERPRRDSVPPGLLMNEDRHSSYPGIPPRLRAYSECTHSDLTQKERVRFPSLTFGGSSLMASVFTLHELPSAEDEEGSTGVWQHFRNHYKPSALKDPLVVSVAVVNCITMVVALNIFSSIPFILDDAGYTLQESATVMSTAAVIDLVTRLAGAAITDLPHFKPRMVFGFAQLIYVVVPYVFLAGSDQWLVVMACAGAFGLGLGCLYILDVLLMVRLLGVEKLQSVLGMSQLLRSVGFIFIGPVGGSIRDVTGNYWATLAFFSSCMLTGFVIMVFTALTYRPKPDIQEDDKPQQDQP